MVVFLSKQVIPMWFLGYNEQKETLANLSKKGMYQKNSSRMDRMSEKLSLETEKKPCQV